MKSGPTNAKYAGPDSALNLAGMPLDFPRLATLTVPVEVREGSKR